MNDNVTRRDVLRSGIATAGAATVGVTGFSGTAAATLDCPKTVGYWKNHPEDWPLEEIRIERGGESPNKYSKETMLDVLDEPPRGDKALIMAKQIIAAQLSIAGLGGPDAGVCDVKSFKATDEEEEDEKTMESAITWLDCADGSCADGWDYLDDPENYEPSRSWVDHRGIDGEPFKDRLDAFNNGELCDDCGGADDGRGEEGRENGSEGDDGGEDGERDNGGEDGEEDENRDSGGGNGGNGHGNGRENGNGPPDHAGGPNGDDNPRRGP